MPLERVLCLDVGDRRVGLAISDELGIVARPLGMVERSGDDDAAALDAILRLFEVEGARRLLVGDPRLPSGDRGEQCRSVDAFLLQLQSRILAHFGSASPPIERWDESDSTKVAEQRLRQRGLDPRKARDSGGLDAEAAAVILQEWLGR
jgi:putative Holliday junction resolvase